MIRFIVGPVIVGILAFSIVFFVIPLLFPASDVVAIFGKLVLDLSNSVFITMPPLVADYLARLNLLGVALSVALLLIVATDVLIFLGDAAMLVAAVMVWIFKRKPKQARPLDLPPLDIDASKLNSRPGSKILGGGFDSLESD